MRLILISFRFLALSILLVNSVLLKAQCPYTISNLPEALIANADAVVRKQTETLNITSIESATLETDVWITLLNAESGYADLEMVYDFFYEVEFLNGEVYGGDGLLLGEIKASDLHDLSLNDGYSIFSDNRYKYWSPGAMKTPLTVHYHYRTHYHSLLHLPDWTPQMVPSIAVEQSSFEWTSPTVKIITRLQDPNQKILVTGEARHCVVKNIPASEPPPFSPSFRATRPELMLKPAAFIVNGIEGSTATWKEMGLWMHRLIENQAVLPGRIQVFCDSLVNHQPDERERAKAVYQYLQSTKRYVSIQLGIGGWQPAPVTVVEKEGYGDCKALSNFMVASLGKAGVKARYALVYAGQSELDIPSDFPGLYFNHAIACAIFGQDTVWLECTNMEGAFGRRGASIAGKHALIIDANGGALVKIPDQKPTDNQTLRKATVFLDSLGAAKVTETTTFTGENISVVRSLLGKLRNEQVSELTERYTLSQPQFAAIKPVMLPVNSCAARLESDFTLKRLGRVSGKRLFFVPAIFTRMETSLPDDSARTATVILHSTSIKSDTLVFTFNKTYTPEFLPEAVSIVSVFGSYNRTVQFANNELLYIRTLQMNAGTWSADNYAELVAFLKKVSLFDKEQIVFLSLPSK